MISWKSEQRGFSLLELLVVIGLLMLLGTIIFVSLSPVRTEARDTKRVQDFRTIRTSLELFQALYGRFPNNTDDDFGDGFDVGNALAANPSDFISEFQAPPFGEPLLSFPVIETSRFFGNESYRYRKFAPGEAPGCPVADTFGLLLIRLERSQAEYGVVDIFGDCPLYSGDIVPSNSDNWLLYIARE